MKKETRERVEMIEIEKIDVPEVVDREEISEEYVEELANSIKEMGLLQPIIVSENGGNYTLVAGHRRILAHLRLGRGEIRATIREMSKGEEALARALENLQRVDLTSIEEAKCYGRMVENLGLSPKEIGKKIGKSEGQILRKLKLLNLPEVLQRCIHQGKIGYAVAEELSGLRDLGLIEYYLGYAVDHGATLSVVRQWVADEKKKAIQESTGGEGGGGRLLMPKSVPVYVPCELCNSAMEINESTAIRCCPCCVRELEKVMKGGEAG